MTDVSSRVPQDRRSVGELLLDADASSRETLWDQDADRAREKVRSWGEVVEVAAALWATIPDRNRDPSMERIHQGAEAMHQAQLRTGWPGAGDPDLGLERVRVALARADELVASRFHPGKRLSDDGHLDSEAVRTRLMHVVYVASHAVAGALERSVRDLRWTLDHRTRLASGDSLEGARAALQRITAAESIAGSYLQTRWPSRLRGEHREAIEPSRLAEALARWETQAHRRLVNFPTASELLVTVAVQREITHAAVTTSTAAAELGLMDPTEHRSRILPAIHGLGGAWGRLSHHLSLVAGQQLGTDRELLAAAVEVRAALREITHDGAAIAAAGVLTERVDLRATSRQLQVDAAVAVDLAHGLKDAIEQPTFYAAARGLNALYVGVAASSGIAAWVEAGDLYQNRVVPLPGDARAFLIGHVQQVIAAAAELDSASTHVAYDPAPVPPLAWPVPSPEWGIRDGASPPPGGVWQERQLPRHPSPSPTPER